MSQDRSSRPPITAADVPAAPPIRLVAIDLDGTLLNDAKQIAPPTIASLRCMSPRGVKVIIASARPPRSVRAFYKSLGLDTLQINYNGALIWDEPAQKPFFHLPMSPGLVGRIIGRARQVHAPVLVSCEILDRWFTDRFDETYTTETGRIFRPDVIAPFEVFLNQPITKLMLLADRATISRLEELVIREFTEHVTAIRGDAELLQITDLRVSKATALRAVADHYGIPLTQTMAIGDAVNDISMLRCAGLAVAMDNAHPAVKAIAHWTAPSNNDHGVLAALRRYGLCK